MEAKDDSKIEEIKKEEGKVPENDKPVYVHSIL